MVLRRRRHAEEPAEVLFDTSKVDFVTLSPDRRTVHLYIVNDSPWTGTDAELTSLQEKIHNYVGFAADGQLASSYPDAAGLTWQIVIDCQAGEPDQLTAAVLAQVAKAVRGYGGDLVLQSSENALPD